MYIHIQACLSGRNQAVPGVDDLPGTVSLTVPVEVGYFLEAAVGRPKSDFPQQPSGSTRLAPAQSGSDSAQRGTSIYEVFFSDSEKTNPIKAVSSAVANLRLFSLLMLSGAWCPVIGLLGSPRPFPTL